MPYLRMTIGRWTIDLGSVEAGEIFQRIQEEGVSVFRRQPGFIRYRLTRAGAHTTIAVAEWESGQPGTAGTQRFRDWLRSSGIAAKLTLETYAGQVVVAS
jgi:heme-degrading monooxygenase HmoA